MKACRSNLDPLSLFSDRMPSGPFPDLSRRCWRLFKTRSEPQIHEKRQINPDFRIRERNPHPQRNSILTDAFVDSDFQRTLLGSMSLIQSKSSIKADRLYISVQFKGGLTKAKMKGADLQWSGAFFIPKAAVACWLWCPALMIISAWWRWQKCSSSENYLWSSVTRGVVHL